MLQRIIMMKKLHEELIPSMIKFISTLKKHQEMKKKKDKVTLKGEVDKPEVFQHIPTDEEMKMYEKMGIIQHIKYSPITETSFDGTDNPYYLDELGMTIGIDPYHIEPIDNPQKLDIKYIEPEYPLPVKEKDGLLNADFEHTGEEVRNSRGFFTSKVIDTSIHDRKEAEERRLIEDQEFALRLLKTIKRTHPEVLEQFTKEHYGKKDS